MSAALRKQMVEKIKEAFGGAPYPGDENIGYDTSYVDVEELSKSFQGLKWQEVPLETINWHRDELPFFTNAAFRYYLPAFMMAALLHVEETDILLENIVFNLCPDPYDHVGWQDTLEERAREFNEKERKLLADFLRAYPQLCSDFYTLWTKADLDKFTAGVEFWENLD